MSSLRRLSLTLQVPFFFNPLDVCLLMGLALYVFQCSTSIGVLWGKISLCRRCAWDCRIPFEFARRACQTIPKRMRCSRETQQLGEHAHVIGRQASLGGQFNSSIHIISFHVTPYLPNMMVTFYIRLYLKTLIFDIISYQRFKNYSLVCFMYPITPVRMASQTEATCYCVCAFCCFRTCDGGSSCDMAHAAFLAGSFFF